MADVVLLAFWVPFLRGDRTRSPDHAYCGERKGVGYRTEMGDANLRERVRKKSSTFYVLRPCSMSIAPYAAPRAVKAGTVSLSGISRRTARVSQAHGRGNAHRIL